MSNSTMNQSFCGLKNFVRAVKNFFKRLMFIYCVFLSAGALTDSVFSQTGPGGVGDWTTNKIWLKENITSTASEFFWFDKSGNGNAFAQHDTSFMPVVVPGAINGRQAVRFNGTSQFLTSITAPSLYNNSQFTSYIVLDAFTDDSGSAMKLKKVDFFA